MRVDPDDPGVEGSYNLGSDFLLGYFSHSF